VTGVRGLEPLERVVCRALALMLAEGTEIDVDLVRSALVVQGAREPRAAAIAPVLLARAAEQAQQEAAQQ